MSSTEVHPFRRGELERLTALVNAHAGAVVPGMSASASTVLSALERRPGEFIEDPWVSERITLVAAKDDRIAVGAHLLRYFPDDQAGTAARDSGEIHWLAFWPEAPARESLLARCDQGREVLIAACVRRLEQWA